MHGARQGNDGQGTSKNLARFAWRATDDRHRQAKAFGKRLQVAGIGSDEERWRRRIVVQGQPCSQGEFWTDPGWIAAGQRQHAPAACLRNDGWRRPIF
jgi:hypothetical protein